MKKLLLAAALLAAVPTFADQITQFAFTGKPGGLGTIGDIGKVDSFFLGPISLIVSGWAAPGVPADMWIKNDAHDEIGIGLAAERDHEISGTQFIQTDLSKIFAIKPTQVTVTINSIQEGESYDIWGGDTKGQLGTLLAADVSSPNFTVSSSFPIISVTSGSEGNVLLNDVTAHFVGPIPTPEPSTGFLLLTGVFGLAIWEGKRKKS